MIKSVMQVVLTVVLSFGVMIAGVNPRVRAELQAAGTQAVGATASIVGSANILLSNLLSGKASVHNSTMGAAAARAGTLVDVVSLP
jgi:hypothetical protein